MSRLSIPRLVMYRPGRSGGLPLPASHYCDRNTDPMEGPRRITRGGRPVEPVATRRLGGSAGVLLDRGSIVRLLLYPILGRGVLRYRARYALRTGLSMANISRSEPIRRI